MKRLKTLKWVIVILLILGGNGVLFAGDQEVIDQANQLIAQLELIKDSTLPVPLRFELSDLVAQRDHVVKLKNKKDRKLEGSLAQLSRKSSSLKEKASKYIQEYQEKKKKIGLSLQCDYHRIIPPVEILFGKEDQKLFEEMLVPMLNDRWLPALEKSIPKNLSRYFPFPQDEESEPNENMSALDHSSDRMYNIVPKFLRDRGFTEDNLRNVGEVLSPEIVDPSVMPDGFDLAISDLNVKFKHDENMAPTFEFISNPNNNGELLIKVTMPSITASADGFMDLILMDEKGGEVKLLEGSRIENLKIVRFHLATEKIPVSMIFSAKAPVVGSAAIDLVAIEVGDEKETPKYAIGLSKLPPLDLPLNVPNKPSLINLTETNINEKISELINDNWKDRIRPGISSQATLFANDYLKPIIDKLIDKIFNQKIPVKNSWPTATSLHSDKPDNGNNNPESSFILPYTRPQILKTKSGEVYSAELIGLSIIQDPQAGTIVRINSEIKKERIEENPSGGAKGENTTQSADVAKLTPIVEVNGRVTDAIVAREKVCFSIVESKLDRPIPDEENQQLACTIYFDAGIGGGDTSEVEPIILQERTIPASFINNDKLKKEGTLFYIPTKILDIAIEEGWIGKVKEQWKREGIRRLYSAINNFKECSLDDMPQFIDWLESVEPKSSKIAASFCENPLKYKNSGIRKHLVETLWKALAPDRIVPTDFRLDKRIIRTMSAPVLTVENSSDSKGIDVRVSGILTDITPGSLVNHDLVDVSITTRVTPTPKGIQVSYVNESAELEIYKPVLNLFLLGHLNSILSSIVDTKISESEFGGVK